MKIGIIASMDAELEYVKERLEDYRTETDGKTLFHLGRIGGNDIIMSKCLTGKVFMAIAAQKMIDRYEGIDLMVNCGVAGALNGNLKIGDVVVCTRTVQHDMDVRGLGLKLGEIPDINILYFEADRRFVETARDLEGYDFSLYAGTIATGDVFVDNPELKRNLVDLFDGWCADMETASLAHVCHVNGISFAGIRGMSDGADLDASGDFLENIRRGSDNCAKVLVDIIKKL